jgi:hypothetical protein
MAIFEEKQISEITADDVLGLRGRPENQSLEFKLHYGNLDQDRIELARDVSALANADGGYIVIGVREEGHVCFEFAHVPNSEDLRQKIRQIISSGISERIVGVETRTVNLNVGLDIVLVSVPDSFGKPHMVSLQGKNEFWRRFETDKIRMSLSEIRQSFIAASNLGQLERAEKKLDKLIDSKSTHQGEVEQRKLAEDPTRFNEITDPRILVERLDIEFKNKIGSKRYFRLTITPKLLVRDQAKIDDQEIKNIFLNPPGQRSSGWNINPMAPIIDGGLGLRSGNEEYHYLSLLRNGHLEFWNSVGTDCFCWMQDGTSYLKHPKLYPYAVTEFPVSFLRFSAALYSRLQIRGGFIWTMQYANIKDSILLPYHPGAIGYASPSVPIIPYPHEYFYRDRSLDEIFDPDVAAFELIKELYMAFNLAPRHIPFFDQSGHFAIKV